jgi:hypothetical protein
MVRIRYLVLSPLLAVVVVVHKRLEQTAVLAVVVATGLPLDT